jgi:hypothetical protein
METSTSENVVSIRSSSSKEKSLKQILKEVPELRGFFRYVNRYQLRTQALELIERKLYLSN